MKKEKTKSLDIEQICGHGSQRGSMPGVTVLAGCRQLATALLCSELNISYVRLRTSEQSSVSGYYLVSQCLRTGFGLVIEFIDHLQVVTKINYTTVTDFHTTVHSTLASSFYLYYPSRIYNIGTIKVSLNHTLPISLYYSIHKVFKSHVKSSQADFLYSSVLLQLTAILLFPCF
jgi:hypothetical protein